MLKKLGISFLFLFCLLLIGMPNLMASQLAELYVQTADITEDGNIEVVVYLNSVENLGGIDLEIQYDSNKVDFISSSIGASLSSSYSDIYHNQEEASLHYVILYPEGIDAHGVLLRATFEMKEGVSYQPSVVVNDIVDNSLEICDIPYVISYQQSNNTWAETPDTSGILADTSVIQKTMEQYGSLLDIQEDESEHSDIITLDQNNHISNTITDTGMDSEIDVLEDTEQDSKKTQKDIKIKHTDVWIIGAVVVVLLVVGVGIVYWKRKERVNKNAR